MNGGARIAKPVSRMQAKTVKSNQNNQSSNGTRLPMSSNVSTTISSANSSPRHCTPSRIPQPDSASPRKSRIPSAPRYHTPNRTYIKSPAKSVTQTAAPPPSQISLQHRRSVTPSSQKSVAVACDSPPPPPPPTQMTVNDGVSIASPRKLTLEETKSYEATPTPSPQPPTPLPQTPPPPSINHSSDTIIINSKAVEESDSGPEESDDEILRVTSDGKVEMTPINSRGQSQVESPIVPSMIGGHHSGMLFASLIFTIRVLNCPTFNIFIGFFKALVPVRKKTHRPMTKEVETEIAHLLSRLPTLPIRSIALQRPGKRSNTSDKVWQLEESKGHGSIFTKN